jgi:hypothetical protein
MCTPNWRSGIVIPDTAGWCPVPSKPQRYWRRCPKDFRPQPDLNVGKRLWAAAGAGGRGRSLRIVANDELLAADEGERPAGGGLMTVADGVESHPVRVRRAHCGRPLSIEVVELMQRVSGRGEAR